MTQTLCLHTLNLPKLNCIDDRIEWFTITVIHIHSLWNRARQEKLVKSMQNHRAGMTCISLPPPKFIRRYLSVRMNREQKSIPYATTSHKQRGSRDLHRGRRASCLSLFSRRWGVWEWVYKRDAQQLLHSLPSSSPL